MLQRKEKLNSLGRMLHCFLQHISKKKKENILCVNIDNFTVKIQEGNYPVPP